ncbi:MAG: hypothetical protein ABI164_11465 [Acidobacteriaceae bacterium]
MPEVLLIGRDQTARLYTDEVLRRGGFHVRAVAPREAKNLVDDGVSYAVVVFSNTLDSRDVAEIGTQLRQRIPNAKLLLLLGPDSAAMNLSLFDASIEGLDGPAALIQVARQLAEASFENGSAQMSA